MSGVKLTKDTLRNALDFWQKMLRLEDWRIDARICRAPDLGNGEYGDVQYFVHQKEAWISILNPKDYRGKQKDTVDWEVILVHELVHLHFYRFWRNSRNSYSSQEETVEMLAYALVHSKRQFPSLQKED